MRRTIAFLSAVFATSALAGTPVPAILTGIHVKLGCVLLPPAPLNTTTIPYQQVAMVTNTTGKTIPANTAVYVLHGWYGKKRAQVTYGPAVAPNGSFPSAFLTTDTPAPEEQVPCEAWIVVPLTYTNVAQ